MICKTSNLEYLTASKICHEFANYLSIIKFLQDDIKTNDSYETREFMKAIELLSLTMDFFRNIYSTVSSSKSLENIVNILQIKEIEIDINSSLKTTNEISTVISVLLYMLSKTMKPKEKITISQIKDEVTITKAGLNCLSQNVIQALLEENVNETIVNLLALHAKKILQNNGYKIKVNTEEDLIISIWK